MQKHSSCIYGSGLRKQELITYSMTIHSCSEVRWRAAEHRDLNKQGRIVLKSFKQNAADAVCVNFALSPYALPLIPSAIHCNVRHFCGLMSVCGI